MDFEKGDKVIFLETPFTFSFDLIGKNATIKEKCIVPDGGILYLTTISNFLLFKSEELKRETDVYFKTSQISCG